MTTTAQIIDTWTDNQELHRDLEEQCHRLGRRYYILDNTGFVCLMAGLACVFLGILCFFLDLSFDYASADPLGYWYTVVKRLVAGVLLVCILLGVTSVKLANRVDKQLTELRVKANSLKKSIKLLQEYEQLVRRSGGKMSA